MYKCYASQPMNAKPISKYLIGSLLVIMYTPEYTMLVLLSALNKIYAMRIHVKNEYHQDASGMEGVSTNIPMSAVPVMTRAGRLYVNIDTPNIPIGMIGQIGRAHV